VTTTTGGSVVGRIPTTTAQQGQLPSTSTNEADAPLAALGGILMAIGALLLRNRSRRIG
jgi:LPXTG-motif cell wall-anchored protein